MSLLIKALQKAEKESSGHKSSENPELSLEPKLANDESQPPLTQQEALNLAKEAGLTSSAWEKKVASQETASFVFEAKAAATPKPSRGPLLAGLLLGVLCIVAGGLYYLEQEFKTPELVVPPRVTHIEGNQVVSQSDTSSVPGPSASTNLATSEAASSSDSPPDAKVAASVVASESNVSPAQSLPQSSNVVDTKLNPPEEIKGSAISVKSGVDTPTAAVETAGSSIRAKPSKSALSVPKISTKGTSPSAEQAWTPTGVSRGKVIENTSSTISEAYQALLAGDDEKAHRLYRMVLKNEARNIDAMLGLASIAQRQNKLQDAQGWYAKVLELDPRNEFALSAVNASVPVTDAASYESKLKSMLAQQPKSASLHASLGSFYAEQGQWGQAQQSYFEAHHLDPMNAEYTYDLAVSLDQLGKGALAAQFYREAISQLKPGQTLFDKEAVQARIQALAP